MELAETETFPIFDMSDVSTDQGVTVATHAGQVRWTISPRNPALLPGKKVPDMLYGDITRLMVNGESKANSHTYAKLDKATRQLTIGVRSLDPAGRP